MAEAQKQLYLVKSRLDHDKRYEAGDTVHLTDEEAEPLLPVGVIELHSTEDSNNDDTPLEKMTKPQLQDLAKEHGLSLPSNSSKDALIAAIAEARAAQQ